MLIDTHCHLLDKRFDIDRKTVIEAAGNAGVKIFIEVACEHSGWNDAVELSQKESNIYISIGVHPHDAAKTPDDTLNKILNYAKNEKIVAIGEMGLDYYYDLSPKDIQRRVFTIQLEIASSLNKPVIIHCREAYADLLEILKKSANAHGGVIHCFSGTPKDAELLVSMGFYLGIDGPLTYPSAVNLKETVRSIPIEKLLLETDSPYLPPQTFRGSRNEPKYLPLIAEEMAKIKGLSVEAVRDTTTKNATELFNLNTSGLQVNIS